MSRLYYYLLVIKKSRKLTALIYVHMHDASSERGNVPLNEESVAFGGKANNSSAGTILAVSSTNMAF